jgi:Calx-beta domain
VPPQPDTIPALGLRARLMFFHCIADQLSKRRNIMSFSSWLRNWKRSAPLARRPSSLTPRQRASFRPRLEALEERSLLSTFTVNSLTDTGTGSGLTGDLRYCIANATSGNDVITFAQGLTGPIKLERTLALNTSVAIQGPGASLLTVEPDSGDFVFFAVGSTASVELSGLTLYGVNALTGGGGGDGAIANNGALTVSACIFSDNSNYFYYGGLYGGAINNNGTAIVSNSTFIGNSGAAGGAIFNSGLLTLNSSTMEANYLNWAVDGLDLWGYGDIGESYGGAIFNQGALTINNSTLAHNSAQGGTAGTGGIYGSGVGGGIFASAGTLSINSSTLSDNRARGADVSGDDPNYPGSGYGGGLFIRGGTVLINNSTIAGNQAIPGLLYSDPTAAYSYGGGICNFAGPGALQMYDTILADNVAYTADPDLYGSVTSLGHNLIGYSTGGSGFVASDLLNVNPLLGPLQNNGGPTQTRALLAGSPAIDAGDNANAPAFDQRGPGFPRIVNGTIDIGAFEVQPGSSTPSLKINDVTVTEGNTGTRAATFTITLSAASTQPVTVAYATANGTATAGSDYQAASGALTFAPGETSKTITVLVNGDRLAEPNETFFVNLSAATNATITTGQGTGTIVDDEPRISISDVTKKEGKKGQTTSFTFTVTLSAAYDQAVTMSYQTVNGTATTGDNDYVGKTGTLTFKPGETSKTITITVNGDSKKEADETFYLDLFGLSSNALLTKSRGIGTILNDD